MLYIKENVFFWKNAYLLSNYNVTDPVQSVCQGQRPRLVSPRDTSVGLT